jgi:UDP-glucose 4-epimerase
VLKLVSNENRLSEDADIKLIDYKDAYVLGFEDMMRRIPDIKKIQGMIGWKSQISLEETLQHMIAFYRAHEEI